MTVADSAVAADRELILAVDDNEQNLQLLEEYLGEWGYDIVLARDGEEAVEHFVRHHPSLVLLDVMMPVMDGYEACRRIKGTSQGRRVPVVMLTALTATEDKVRALDTGADDFLNKPINKDELRVRIRALLRIRRLRRELDSSENIIVTLTAALENKDPRSGGHVQRVADYSGRICDALGMSSDDRETIVHGALLHDVGMIGVPDELLVERGRLTATDDERLRQHTWMGASILEPLKTFRRFIPMVLWHHERLDGSGFPDGLRADDIPVEAQIVGIANRFDELRHEDPVATEAAALQRLREESARGSWTPSLVDALERSLLGRTPSAGAPHILLRTGARRPKILCVDHSSLNRDVISESLREAGFHDVHVSNGDEAITALRADRDIDLLVCDLMPASQDSERMILELRREPQYEFLPVIVLTAQRNEQARRTAILAGADDFIAYPIHRVELIARIRSLLRIRDYHDDLEQTQNIICALALAVEAKDDYTRGHSQRVGDLAHAFARHLEIGTERADRLRIAGLLHDIGKIAVPEAFLNKKGPLTREEFLRVLDHPVIGEDICRPLQSLKDVLVLIRHHHERFDGRGYPDGLAGEDIPLEVRLLSVIDAYDALTSHRSYRPQPLTHEAALETLRREADAGKWDPRIVQEFCAMLGPAPPDFERMTLPIPRLDLTRRYRPQARVTPDALR